MPAARSLTFDGRTRAVKGSPLNSESTATTRSSGLPGAGLLSSTGSTFLSLGIFQCRVVFLGGQLKLATAFFSFLFCTPNYLVDSFLNYLVGFPSQHEQSIVSPFVSIKHLVGFLSLP